MKLTTKIFIGSILTIFVTVIAIICIAAYMERTKDESMYLYGKRIEYIDIEDIDSLIIESADMKKKRTFNYMDIKTSESTKNLSVYNDTYKIISSTKRGNTLIIKLLADNPGLSLNSNSFFLTLPTQSSFSIINNIPHLNVYIGNAKMNHLFLHMNNGVLSINESQLKTLDMTQNISNRGPKNNHPNLFRKNVTIGNLNYTGNDVVDGQKIPFSIIKGYNKTPESNDSIFMNKMNGLE